jgi:hypothetical protein
VANDPEATIAKARVIRAAASAPAEPSSQDRAVAAAASQLESQARQDLLEQQRQVRSEQADPRPTYGEYRPEETPQDRASQSAAPEISAYSQQSMRPGFNAVA